MGVEGRAVFVLGSPVGWGGQCLASALLARETRKAPVCMFVGSVCTEHALTHTFSLQPRISCGLKQNKVTDIHHRSP